MNSELKESKKLNVTGAVLSREEMKTISGGRWMACFCWQSSPPKTWFANYGTVEDAIVDINQNCGEAGGNCS